MLTVPSSIKTLYMTDGVRKNFRAHFPNGEYSDITNENVVTESVHFTESLCSQSVFKFGLSEASVLEFETVGIGNMFGMTIEASIEIDTSSLSAAQISAIQTDEGDGTLVLVGDSDIGYGFYRIPFGSFRVESCPRNHEAMTHRKVTAYTEQLGTEIPISPIEALKFQSWQWWSGYYVNINRLLDASLGYFSPNILYDLGYTRTQVTTFSALAQTVVSNTEQLFTITKNSVTYTFTMYGAHSYRQYDSITYDKLYGLELDGLDPTGAADFIKNILDEEGLDWTTASPWLASKIPFPTNYDIFIASYSKAVPVFSTGGTMSGLNLPSYTRAPIYQDAPSVYAMNSLNYGSSSYGNFYIPESFTLRVEKQGGWTKDYVFDIGSANPRIYRWDKTATNIKLSLPSSKSKSFQVIGGYATTSDWYQFSLPAEYAKLISGYIEMQGGFVSARRLGGYEFTRLNSSVDADIGKHYSEAWWDEYDVAPIGQILLSYQDTSSGEIETSLQIGNGASVYDMKDNEVLRGSSRTLTEVSNYLNASFVPNIGAVYFTPIELSYPCFPWLEAGDKIKFLSADDSEEVESYLLRIDTTGIQNIFSNAESDGGSIMTEA